MGISLRIFILMVGIVSLCCCSGGQRDSRLTRVTELIDDSLHQATILFETVNPDSLSDADHRLYDFLSVKIADKNFITHTSDSLILKVIKQEEQHKDDGRYPEALYYGGRVYSDLGDYPTSLGYFQQSLDRLSEETGNARLRSAVLSQTGRLLESLRLFDEAIPYVKDAIELNRQLNDSVNEMHNLQLLGSIYEHADKPEQAEGVLIEALRKCRHLSPSREARCRIYLAAVKYNKGNLDSALALIRDVPAYVSPISRNTALAHATRIYHAKGLHDTAYMYAHELISSEDDQNKETGYQMILSPELRKFVNPDSIDLYLSEYSDLLESYYDDNEVELAINRQNMYVYQCHVREKEKAVNNARNLRILISVIVITGLLIIIIVTHDRYRLSKRIIGLNAKLQRIEKIDRNQKQVLLDGCSICNDQTYEDSAVSLSKSKENELRERFREKLLSLVVNNRTADVTTLILTSDPYQEVQKHILEERVIGDDDGLWKRLEETITASSPRFKDSLNILTSGRITHAEYRTCLLIKCGLRPSQIANLVGRTIATVGSRRDSIARKIFEEKKPPNVIDNIILLL